MKRCLFITFIIVLTITCLASFSSESVTQVDFPKLIGLNGNSQGPHILIADSVNLKIFAPCINSSSVAVIDAKSDKVSVIPIASRMPRKLRVQGAAINHKSGELALAGQNSIIIVDAGSLKSRSIELNSDYPSVAFDESTGNILAVGRTSAGMAVIKAGSDKVNYVKYGHKDSDVQYFAVSAPTPIRTVWVDKASRKIFIFDGTLPKLYILDADTFEVISSRSLPVPPFPRWHWGGPDWEDNRFYLSVEDDLRVSRFAVSVDLKGSDDVVVPLPAGATEPTGVSISTKRNELYIPYDNNDFIHAISFTPQPKVEQIMHNSKYGIDSSIYDEDTGFLYALSWADGIMYEINVSERKVNHHTPYFPVYPHMNNFAYIPSLGKIYVPSGATAVNGTFGSLITVFNVKTLEMKTLRTGWSPVGLAEINHSGIFAVSGSDDSFALVSSEGSVDFIKLPFPYLHDVLFEESGKNIYISYGLHYSVFPVFYIRATRGGIYKLDERGELLTERQTDRLAQKMLIDDNNVLWATENIWGKEEPRLVYYDLSDQSKWGKLYLPPAIDNECSLRRLKKNPENGDLWILRNGDRPGDSGLAHRVNPKTKTLLATYNAGVAPTDIAFLERTALIVSFTEDKLTAVNALSGAPDSEKPITIKTGSGPIAVAVDPIRKEAYIVNHKDSSLTVLSAKEGSAKILKTVKIPGNYRPGNAFFALGYLYISAHNASRFVLYRYNPSDRQFKSVIENDYPYGEVSFDQSNTAFANPAQWGDAVYRLNEFASDAQGRLWVTDYLSGKLWILKDNEKER